MKKKAEKKYLVRYIFIITAILLLALLGSFLFINSRESMVFAATKTDEAIINEELVKEQPILYINDKEYDGIIELKRGENLEIVFKYYDEIYLPNLYVDNDKFNYEIKDNIFMLKKDSYVVDSLILNAKINIKDKEVFKNIEIKPIFEDNISNCLQINEENEKLEVIFNDKNIISMYTSITMQDKGVTYKTIYNGDDLSDIIEISAHGKYGIIKEIDFYIDDLELTKTYCGIVCYENQNIIRDIDVDGESLGLNTLLDQTVFNINHSSFLGFFGGIAGKNADTIYNCNTSFEVASMVGTGGIVGVNDGEVYDCESNITIKNAFLNTIATIGGIVATSQVDSHVYNCATGLCVMFPSSDGTLQQSPKVGGIVGYNLAQSSYVYNNSNTCLNCRRVYNNCSYDLTIIQKANIDTIIGLQG